MQIFMPYLGPGDAVGGHALQLRRLARELWGQADIWAEASHPSMVGECRPFKTYSPRPSDVCVYQMAIGSVLADFLVEQRAPLVVNYHNITPAHWFEAWEPALVHGMSWGRVQLAIMAERTVLGVADSEFNRAELIDVGYHATAVAPILLDLSTFDAEAPDPTTLARLSESKSRGGSDWLFVGRVAPHKCQHDVVNAFAAYRRLYDGQARLHLVGGSSSASYWAALESSIAVLGLTGAVTLTASLSHSELVAHYQAADVFVCLSEHEGFCVPLLEAMHHRLPIVAHAAAAVPGTLGRAGLLLHDKSPVRVAAAVQRAVSDDAVRSALVRAGCARLADFELGLTRQAMADALAPLLADS